MAVEKDPFVDASQLCVGVGSKTERMAGDVIAVSLPGTAYLVLFGHRPDQPRLFQDAQLSVDKQAPMAHRNFEAIAWEAASRKARELGWFS